MRATASLLAAVLAIVLSLGTPASLCADETRARLAALDPKYRDWFDEVDLLIGKDERRQFLALTRDYQRDGFIHRFWEALAGTGGRGHPPTPPMRTSTTSKSGRGTTAAAWRAS